MPVQTKNERAKAYNDAIERMTAADTALDEAPAETTDEARAELRTAYDSAVEEVSALRVALDDADARERAREQHKPLEIHEDVTRGAGGAGGGGGRREGDDERTARARLKVNEPDFYRKRGGTHGFLHDLYLRDCKNNHAAGERLAKHQEFEIERYFGDLSVQERAVATGTLGGAIPPQYLVGLYAKAGRNGRVYANQANHQELPETGMSMIIPRLTVGLAAAVQTAESAVVTTQDPTEVDLSVPVRTIAGYSPVSRQTLERAAYSEQILMEDLVARYAAALDVQCINGSGAAGQMLGVLQTAGISTSTVATATAVAIWPKIADLIQQIDTAFGGLGILADKIIMHPRRWGMFTAALDTQNRPLYSPAPMVLNTDAATSINPFAALGDSSAYGYTGAMIQGLPVFTDANIPTNLGGGTNEDRIIVQATQAVLLWERPDDPVTLAFEQTNGTALQVQLICYGYAGFTAGRYPAASGVVSGAGLVPPTF